MQQASILRRGLTFSELWVGLVFVAIAALACLSPAQSDTFWALRAGEDIWRSGKIPLVDTYSYTAAGRHWPNHECLWQALAYALHRLGGFPLLTAAVAAMLTLAYAIAYRLMAGSIRLRLALLAVGLPLGTIGWSLRPQVASLLLLAVLLWLLVRGRYWLIPLLFGLWANVHGGVVLGGLVMVMATAAALCQDRRRFWRLALATALGGLATLLTPLGLGLWDYVIHRVLLSRHAGISEWAPLRLGTKEGIVFFALALAFSILVVRRWRKVAAWPDRVLAVVALAFLGAAARHVRNVTPFLLVALPAASRLHPAASIRAIVTEDEGSQPARAYLVMLLAGAILAGGAIVLSWSTPIKRLGWRPISAGVQSVIEACPEPLYNSYELGGVLEWFVRSRRVFIDSRQDPYPPEFVAADRQVEEGGDHRALFDRYGFQCAVLAADAKLASRLRAAGWIPRYQDSQWVVLARAR
jgi:hypothetical protein